MQQPDQAPAFQPLPLPALRQMLDQLGEPPAGTMMTIPAVQLRELILTAMLVKSVGAINVCISKAETNKGPSLISSINDKIMPAAAVNAAGVVAVICAVALEMFRAWDIPREAEGMTPLDEAEADLPEMFAVSFDAAGVSTDAAPRVVPAPNH